jgi:hypothetical protein
MRFRSATEAAGQLDAAIARIERGFGRMNAAQREAVAGGGGRSAAGGLDADVVVRTRPLVRTGQ